MIPNYQLIQSSFVTSAQNITQCPPALFSEIVFLGRSNVGKSTFINLLCNQKNLAKKSQTPGKTRLINFFLTQWKNKNQEILNIYLVDLPGFGYAKVTKTQKELWSKNLIHFLQKRDSIKLFVHLVDSRHSSLLIDKQLVEFINSFARNDQKLLRIFTKFDKLNANEKVKLKNSFSDAKFCSSLQKTDIVDLRDFLIESTLGRNKDIS